MTENKKSGWDLARQIETLRTENNVLRDTNSTLHHVVNKLFDLLEFIGKDVPNVLENVAEIRKEVDDFIKVSDETLH